MKTAFLLLPLAISIVLAIRLRMAGKDWRGSIVQGVSLGFTLPLAAAYCIALPWPDWTDGFFSELLTRFSIALVVMPQVYVLAPAGILLWTRFIKSGFRDAGGGLVGAFAILAVAILGHVWTWAILSAGPAMA